MQEEMQEKLQNAAPLQKLFYEYQTKCRRTIAKWAKI